MDFRQEMNRLGVKPLRGDRRILPQKHVPPRQSDHVPSEPATLDAPYMYDHIDEHDPEFRRNGVSAKLLKQLASGKVALEASIDLHGMCRERARHQVGMFIHSRYLEGCRAVKIIHGKGGGFSRQPSVLKPLVNGWLRQLHEVLGFCPAPQHDGGSGALYVLLRRRRQEHNNQGG
jgi:DNA-nicking Smr family endonuclease